MLEVSQTGVSVMVKPPIILPEFCGHCTCSVIISASTVDKLYCVYAERLSFPGVLVYWSSS